MAEKGFFSDAGAGGRRQAPARLRATRRAVGAAQRLDARAALARGVARLREAGLASLGREAGLAAELLLLSVIGHEVRRDRAWLYAHPEYVLSAAEWEAYDALLARRASGVPVQYLTGVQEFWGLEFEVTPSVLIPRPETEHVVEVALEWVEERGIPADLSDVGLNIADVGTGSGCVAVALATELPGACVVATDISAAALEVARRNALRQGVEEHVRFVRADLLDLRDAPRGGASGSASATLAGREGDAEVFPQFFHHGSAGEPPLFDLIVSNPPYVARNDAASLAVEVRDYEPHEALFGGATGVEIYARLIAQAAGALRAGGVLVLELGYDSLEHVQALLARCGCGAGWRCSGPQLELERHSSDERPRRHSARYLGHALRGRVTSRQN